MKQNQRLLFRETATIYCQHLARYPIATIGLILAILFAMAVSMTSPLIIQQLIDVLVGMPPNAPHTFDVAMGYIWIYVTIQLGGWILWRVSGFLSSYVQPRLLTDLERTALEVLHKHSYRFFSDEFTGSLIRRVSRFSTSALDIAEVLFGRFIPLIVELGFLFIVFTRLHIIFLPVLGIWILILTWKSVFFVRKKLKFDLERAAKDSAVTGLLSDIIANASNVKLFIAQSFERNNFFKFTEERLVAWVRSWRFGEWELTFKNFLNAILMFVTLTLLVWFWTQGRVGLGIFTTALLYYNRINRSMDDLGHAMRRVYEAFAEAAEMTEIILQKPDVVDRRGAKQLVLRRGAITFQDVIFNYSKTRRVLDRFTLSISPREKIALVGPSGAGKSTIVKLLFRFYDLDRGKILIDGQSIAEVTQESLRGAIALVPQDPVLFHRTLKENIRYGRRDARDEEVIEAAKKAHAHEFIEQAPEGYDTYVGERGIKLSGGERQRIAIARAILKNAPILVLDEATSSLDSESESLIQDALRELMKNKTVIVIAHRLSTIMQMDRIIVVQDGKVVDMGTHDELLQKVGVYQKLWNIQMTGYREGLLKIV